MILRSLGCHRRGGCSELPRPWFERGLFLITITSFEKVMLGFQNFLLCLLVSLMRIFLLIESASDLHGDAFNQDGEATSASNFAQPLGIFQLENRSRRGCTIQLVRVGSRLYITR